MIENPVLRGFHADPSICRVGDTYYIATSTFEWFPGVRIHASTDLANWTLVAQPLDRAGLLDMRGNPDSCGIWAPCLSYADGRFWLVYTDVKRLEGDFKDAHNYITSAPSIEGPWSDRVYVNSSGFDPSLFHDSDGRKWFLNMRWNHGAKGSGCNPTNDRFDGIELQEWHPEHGLFGPVHTIYVGTNLGLTEAPHLFKRGEWYYLTVAEGGTGYDHAVTMARSRSIIGPYETHPQMHLMTARFDAGAPLQRVGHGQYVDMPDGTALHTFLCGRPVHGPHGPFCATGRETGLALCEWRSDDWLYLKGGDLTPPLMLDIPATRTGSGSSAHDFTQLSTLPNVYQWLRSPQPERLFRFGKNGLHLIGRESIGSWFEQALIAQRQCESTYTAMTSLRCDPPNFQRAAGLVTYYNRHKFHAVWITRDSAGQRILAQMSCLGDWQNQSLTHGAQTPVPEGEITLRVHVAGANQHFFWGTNEVADTPLGEGLDASIISDEGGRGEHASFTGAFVGMFAMDLTGQGWGADFSRFSYVNG